jgi:hypothetical protein
MEYEYIVWVFVTRACLNNHIESSLLHRYNYHAVRKINNRNHGQQMSCIIIFFYFRGLGLIWISDRELSVSSFLQYIVYIYVDGAKRKLFSIFFFLRK